MYKLALEKAEEQEIKLPSSAESSKKQGNSGKTSTSALLTTLTPLTVGITANCGKLFKEIGIPDHLTCLLQNLYVGQEATDRTGHEQWTCSKLRKEYVKAVYCHCLFNFYAEYIM